MQVQNTAAAAAVWLLLLWVMLGTCCPRHQAHCCRQSGSREQPQQGKLCVHPRQDQVVNSLFDQSKHDTARQQQRCCCRAAAAAADDDAGG